MENESGDHTEHKPHEESSEEVGPVPTDPKTSDLSAPDDEYQGPVIADPVPKKAAAAQSDATKKLLPVGEADAPLYYTPVNKFSSLF